MIIIDDFVMLGKTVPEPSSDGRIFVCSAGVSPQLKQLLRIYPLARHGDPAEWDGEMPLEFLKALCGQLQQYGWTIADYAQAYVEIDLTQQGEGRPRAVFDDERFSVWWHQDSEQFMWDTHEADHNGYHPNPYELLAEVDPEAVAQQIDRVLRTGSVYGTP